VDKFTKIAREVQLGFTSVGENVTSILIGYSDILIIFIPIFQGCHICREMNWINCIRYDVIKTILGAIPLTPLCEGAVSMSYQLMRTSSGDTLDFEGEIDVFHN
jgi:hypothetical protein